MDRLRLAVLLLSIPAMSAAAGADDKLSVGRIGLLLAKPDAPGVTDTVAAGLRHQRAEVRAAAARAAYSLAARSLTAPLAAALRDETDVWAAAEQVQALAALDAPDVEVALLEASGRLGPRLAAVSAAVLARSRGPAALDVIPALRARGLNDVRPLLRVASRGSGDALGRAGSAALREADGETWTAILDVAEEVEASLPDGLFVAAAGSSSAPVRAATYWHLAGRAAPLPDVVKEALAQTPEASGSGSDVQAAFAYEVLSRALGRKPRRDPAWLERLASTAPMSMPAFPLRPRLNALLTKEERRAVSKRTSSDDDALDEALKSPKGRTEAAPESMARGGGQLWLVSGLPAGFVSGVLAASGCHTKPDELAAAQVRFRPNGRPARVTLKIVPQAAGCLDAARAVFGALAAPDWRLPDEHEDLVVLRFDRASLACLDEPPAEIAEQPRRPGWPERITPPRKAKHVAPHYPPEARRMNVQGMVVLEATISQTGCVRGLRVLTGPPALTVAALAAVAQWRYEPARLGSEPVRVIMTVSVNFSLR